MKKLSQKTTIRKTYEAVTKALENEDRTLLVTISTKNPDRSNDEVMPDGMVIENYLKNPVVAAFHNYHEPAIGKTLELTTNDNGVTAKVQFTPEGVNPVADMLYELYKGGFMNAWSIGFIPTEYTQKAEKGYVISKWELLEYSAVLVPDNPEALTMLRGKGYDVDAIMAKEIEDGIVDKPAEKKEEKHEEIKEEKEAIKKDVAETVSLAYIIDSLNWMIKCFENNEVSTKATDKMKEALALLMEVIKFEAELGVKEFGTATKKKGVSIKFLKSLRDSLRENDKSVGLALRSINEALKSN